MPEQYTVTAGKSLHLNGVVQAVNVGEKSVQKVSITGNSYRSSLRLFGVIPIKEVGIQVVDETVVMVAGTPFGIKMYTDGVLVVGFSDVNTKAGLCNPARIAGLKKGDVILSVNDESVSTNGEIREKIEASKGEEMLFRVRRDHLIFTVKFKAVLSESENRYKSGFWVRDSSAGIGTLTFYDPDSKVFGGLGHAVCDVDTDEIIPISTGEIVNAEIIDVDKGVSGSAGSLNGVIDHQTTGYLTINAETGVFGILKNVPQTHFETVPVAMKQQVKEGKAQIYTTVEGTTPQLYDIEIKQIRYQDASPTKNMVIQITDPKLLEKTGGIVQGMSGSPIVQNGKLIGAVTHVLVNDPKKGYGIFAENMLKTAQSVEKEQLKEAS
jgi:stage IV sporulation protein B